MTKLPTIFIIVTISLGLASCKKYENMNCSSSGEEADLKFVVESELLSFLNKNRKKIALDTEEKIYELDHDFSNSDLIFQNFSTEPGDMGRTLDYQVKHVEKFEFNVVVGSNCLVKIFWSDL